jgi:uncharacterized protein (TIGR00369 family)
MSLFEADAPHETRRERTVVWQDAKSVAPLVGGLSGLEIMRGIRDGAVPPPPMARLIGFRCTVAEPGEVAMQLDHDPSLENTMGMFHGGAVATLLDTAMGCAAHTLMDVPNGIVTLDLTLTFLRPVTASNAPVTAIGRVLNKGRQTLYVTGEVRDRADKLVAHAVGNFSIVAPRSPPSTDSLSRPEAGRAIPGTE